MADTSRFRCLSPLFQSLLFKDDDCPTNTSIEQKAVEESVLKCYRTFRSSLDIYPDMPFLDREMHTDFLTKGLQTLSSSYECLDSSRPWLCYWILHSLELLEVIIPEERALAIANFLGKCQDPEGGFGGGPMQFPHLAPTYAAVNALCILANVTNKVFDVINREKLYNYLMRMKTKEGAFKMHDGGEVDIRGVYCAVSVARLTNILTKELSDGVADFITRCQTYEGGFSGYPGLEAHGGYTFCGIAALVLLNHTERCDLRSLLRWTANRQTQLEGGFQGRTNKLVDGCYSFWQGATFPIVHMIMCTDDDDQNLSAERWMFHQEALQEYILICCQHSHGGLIDKPGKARDHYHTCYCLSGLSVAQHFIGGSLSNEIIIGNPQNRLRPVQPVYNLSLDSVMMAQKYFGSLKLPSGAANKC
ncbi:protein farnesyltransferase subunit beta-like [Biomphalaria glabrata]|uniref:Protein farnesyltransferase subunit beta n=1 Tax=Biomphalaria glabrata TaxID=6526 RepID=A0A9W2ZXZ6_BIOGL|nr:protein farnesyltransferase subunit beta-like [Biomphalaria glabrata]KAI8735274.1 protein farnesyltransferase subunit beta-like [Biomphalaria glabrata]